MAIVLSALVAEYFIIPPIHSLRLNAAGAFELAVFLGVAFLINSLTSAYQKREKDLRESEKTMRESETRLSDIFGSCPVAVLINRTSDRQFVDVNEEFTPGLLGGPAMRYRGAQVTNWVSLKKKMLRGSGQSSMKDRD